MKPISVKNNIIANYASAFWNTLMSVAFVPVYIKYIGVEAYGIIGFFSSIQTVLFLLNMGLSLTFSREVASLSAKENGRQKILDLLKTFSTVYWIISAFAGMLFISITPIVAKYWLKPEVLTQNTIVVSTIMMGLVIAVKWPSNIYSGGILGLQRNVDNAKISIFTASLRGFGAIFVLHFISATLECFFVWQLIVSLTHTILLRIVLYGLLPTKDFKPKFNLMLVKERWKFATGLMGINVLQMVLTQTDKLILSKIVALSELGYYTIANSVSGIVLVVVVPLLNVFFPKFTVSVAKNNNEEFATSFHIVSQLVALAVVPLAITIAFNSKDILLVWTRNSQIASNSCAVLSILITGTMLNAFTRIIYQAQLAVGVTRPFFNYNLISLIFFIPAAIYLSKTHGIVGGASVWLLINIGFIVFAVPVMFRLVLSTERNKWYIHAFFIPVLVSVAVNILFRLLISIGDDTLLKTVRIMTIFITSALLTVLSLKHPKRYLFNYIKSKKICAI